MDPSAAPNGAEPDPRVSGLVDQFFNRRHAGEKLTPERFMAEHPELAAELRPCLDGLPLIHEACTLGGEDDAGEGGAGARELPTFEGFELIEELGRGGMGVVYKAVQTSTKRVVVVKVMLAGPFASRAARRRFDREVELAARLRHPHIVSVLESGESAGQRYYAMDYVSGVGLGRYLVTMRPDVRTTLGLLAEVCEAVEYAHRHNIVHRDLKPANVLVDDEGQPHILDFGLAKATDPVDTEEAVSTFVSLPGQVLGTLFYLSPEQAAGTPDDVDARTDVYALGVMLYEALTGSLPFETSGRPSDVIQRILDAAPTRPTALSPSVDSELETIVLKALEKDKAQRYPSAGELAADLRRYLTGEPIRARRPSGFYVLRKKLSKHRVAASLGAAVAIAVIAMIAGALWWERHDRAEARRSAAHIQRAIEEQRGTLPAASARALHERRPELPETLLVWGQAQYRGGHPDAAIRVLEGTLRHDPSRWACRALLAEIYRATGDAERAETLDTQAEAEAPDTAEAWYLRSFATFDTDRALECAQQAVNRAPSHVLAWSRLAHLHLRDGDTEGAYAAADRLIALGEDEAEWSFFKAHLLTRQRRFGEAIEQYSRAMAADPRSSAPHCFRAHAYRRVGEYDKAVADYTRALELEGDVAANVWYFYQRATPLWILGRREEAQEDYRRVRVRLGRPFFSDARRYVVLRELGREQEAREVLAGALRDAEDPWLRNSLRCLAGELGPEELVAAAAAENDRERLCEACYYAGEFLLLSNQPAEARKWFERCVETGVEFDLDSFPLSPMNEYELAEWRLKSLPANMPPAAP